MTTKSAIEMMISSFEKEAAECEKSAQNSFQAMDNQLLNLRSNGEFVDAPVIALRAASSFLEAYAKDAKEKLETASQLRRQAGNLRSALSIESK